MHYTEARLIARPLKRDESEGDNDEYEQLEVRRENKVAVCAIRNPPRNLMNGRTVGELDALIQELEADDSVRAVVFTGGVDGIFITHYDVSELSAIPGRKAPLSR